MGWTQKQPTPRLQTPGGFYSVAAGSIGGGLEGRDLGHVTPHGLRSYFVTRARESGLSDAEIAMLIGDRTGPAIIAHTYGDVRPDHLLKQAKRIRLTVTPAGGGSNGGSNMSPGVTTDFNVSHPG